MCSCKMFAFGHYYVKRFLLLCNSIIFKEEKVGLLGENHNIEILWVLWHCRTRQSTSHVQSFLLKINQCKSLMKKVPKSASLASLRDRRKAFRERVSSIISNSSLKKNSLSEVTQNLYGVPTKLMVQNWRPSLCLGHGKLQRKCCRVLICLGNLTHSF